MNGEVFLKALEVGDILHLPGLFHELPFTVVTSAKKWGDRWTLYLTRPFCKRRISMRGNQKDEWVAINLQVHHTWPYFNCNNIEVTKSQTISVESNAAAAADNAGGFGGDTTGGGRTKGATCDKEASAT